jgi:hypothetical protein
MYGRADDAAPNGLPTVTYRGVEGQENYCARADFMMTRARQAYFDDLELRIEERFVKFQSKERLMGTKTAILSIADLKSEDLPKLRDAFRALPGVAKIDFSLERSVAVLEFDPSQSHIDDFLRAALKAGFQVL